MRKDSKNLNQDEDLGSEDGMRLNKFLAKCGIAARRKAAELVKEGLVKVNGSIQKNPATLVTEKDRIYFKGKKITPVKETIYYLLNKPKNVISTVEDDRGRRTVIDLIKVPGNKRIFPIGRLDRNTTGLLLLTNDGDLAQKLNHPKYEVQKIYHVVLDRNLKPSDLEFIREGLTLEDGPVAVSGIEYVKNKKSEIGLEIHIGRNRIVRRIFEHLGYEVRRLDRVYYAGLTKKDLPRGRYRQLTKREVIMLKHFI